MEKKYCQRPYFTYTVRKSERTFPKTQSRARAQLRFLFQLLMEHLPHKKKITLEEHAMVCCKCWGFGAFWFCLALWCWKERYGGDRVTSEKIFSNPHHQTHFLLWASVIFLNPKWYFLHFQVPCSQTLQETPNFIKIMKLTRRVLTITICKGVLSLLTTPPTPSVLE